MFDLYVLNLVIVVGMFIVTIYRAWIERKQLKAQEKLELLKAILRDENEVIKELSGEEFIDMLEAVFSEAI